MAPKDAKASPPVGTPIESAEAWSAVSGEHAQKDMLFVVEVFVNWCARRGWFVVGSYVALVLALIDGIHILVRSRQLTSSSPIAGTLPCPHPSALSPPQASLYLPRPPASAGWPCHSPGRSAFDVALPRSQHSHDRPPNGRAAVARPRAAALACLAGADAIPSVAACAGGTALGGHWPCDVCARRFAELPSGRQTGATQPAHTSGRPTAVIHRCASPARPHFRPHPPGTLPPTHYSPTTHSPSTLGNKRKSISPSGRRRVKRQASHIEPTRLARPPTRLPRTRRAH